MRKRRIQSTCFTFVHICVEKLLADRDRARGKGEKKRKEKKKNKTKNFLTSKETTGKEIELERKSAGTEIEGKRTLLVFLFFCHFEQQSSHFISYASTNITRLYWNNADATRISLLSQYFNCVQKHDVRLGQPRENRIFNNLTAKSTSLFSLTPLTLEIKIMS